MDIIQANTASIPAIFDDLGDNTKRNYIASWKDFCAFIEAGEPIDGVRKLIEAGQGGANFMVSRYRKHLLDSNVSPSTAKTRLGGICGIIKRCRRFGLCNFSLDIESINTRAMSGVQDNPISGYSSGQANDVEAIFRKINTDTPFGARDRAIIELLYNPSLRRMECANLDVADVDMLNSRLSITGKARHGAEWVPMPQSARTAILQWLNYRGNEPGPLFVRMDVAAKGLQRLTTQSIYNIVLDRASAVGITAWPHALRHTGITDVAAATNGDIVTAATYARHKNTNTTMVYINNLADKARSASNLIDRLRA